MKTAQPNNGETNAVPLEVTPVCLKAGRQDEPVMKGTTVQVLGYSEHPSIKAQFVSNIRLRPLPFWQAQPDKAEQNIISSLNYHMKLYYAYIVECADRFYYTGFTSNLDKRTVEHN